MMSRLTYIILVTFMCLNVTCSETNEEPAIPVIPINPIKACDSEDPLNELDWLNEFVSNALADKSGNYLGNIWIFRFSDNDIIATDMALGSGGILYHFFDCQGNVPPKTDIPQAEEIHEYLLDDNLVFATSQN